MRKLLRCRARLVLLVLSALTSALHAQIGVGISIRVAPPALPVYTQPPCPTPGFMWTPGYWAHGSAGYFWTPGVWVAPPRPGVLWTPPYWGFAGGIYGFHAGYWGPHVGFYGGLNYGFGYGGVGFAGGMWQGGAFHYNTAVANVNTSVIHDTYVNRTVINNTTGMNHASFNGPGGISAQPSPQERMALNEQHFPPTSNQMQHQQTASQDHNQWASNNGGRPGTTAMNRVNGAGFNQQGRIAQGISSGQLNARETGRLENQEAKTNQEIHADRQANGGRLNQQERQQLRQLQRQTSQHIYNQKHDAQHAPR